MRCPYSVQIRSCKHAEGKALEECQAFREGFQLCSSVFFLLHHSKIKEQDYFSENKYSFTELCDFVFCF